MSWKLTTAVGISIKKHTIQVLQLHLWVQSGSLASRYHSFFWFLHLQRQNEEIKRGEKTAKVATFDRFYMWWHKLVKYSTSYKLHSIPCLWGLKFSLLLFHLFLQLTEQTMMTSTPLSQFHIFLMFQTER